MPKTTDKVADAAESVKPYVDRVLRDEKFRDDVKSALDSARTLYSELIGGRGVVPVATRLATDKDIQDELRSAIADLKSATSRVQGKADHTGRNSVLLLFGIAIGVLFNPVTGPQTRKYLSDRLFGEDEFDYETTSATNGGS
jgi:hypothetical protein